MFNYPLIEEFRFDSMLCSNLGNENFDVGHIKHFLSQPTYFYVRGDCKTETGIPTNTNFESLDTCCNLFLLKIRKFTEKYK